MKQIVFLALFGFAACGRLDNVYLPPHQRRQPSRLTPGQYSGATGQYSRPSGQYGTPSAGQYSGGAAGQYSGGAAGQYSGGAAGQYSGGAAGQYSGGAAGHYSAAQQIPILRLEDNNNGDGTYSYAYETGNGIAAQEQGDARGDGTRAQGGFSYTAPDGQQVQIQYTADENGYQPQGPHVPQIPEAIQRSIQQNLADEARGVVDDGQYRAGPSEQSGISQQYGAPQQFGGAQQFNAQKQYIPPAFQRRQGGYKY